MICFNKPYMSGKELDYVSEVYRYGHLSGDGPFSHKCHQWLEHNTSTHKALLTHSCTAALEMAAILLDLKSGDEVIMPSYTFVSTANAFVLRGARPVFVDIRQDTLNIDETLIEAAITDKTKAIVVVHYAGVACEMDQIVNIADKYRIKLVEDAAQAIMSTYKGRALGSIGDLGCYSFHETKNIIAGEGGALLVNDPELVLRAEVIREKGTDRSQFIRGEVDKYTWNDVGSSFLPSEIMAAFLWAQLECANDITQRRLALWQNYHQLLEPLASQGLLCRPSIPSESQHNAHMYYVILNPLIDREKVLRQLKNYNIMCTFHYVPLHSSPAGRFYAKVSGTLENTDKLSSQLIRLPLWVGISGEQQQFLVNKLGDILKGLSS